MEQNNILGIEFLGTKVPKEGEQEDKTLYGGIVRQGGYSNFLLVKSSHLIPFNYPGPLEEKIAVPEAFLTAF